EDTEGEIKREQTQEQRTEKDSMYELSAKNDRLKWVQRMNNIKSIAKEIIINNIIMV
ncbi:MAG: TnpV protein, partial [Clostridiales bacterium]|nr:TnpV protein [Clostridiales bacterium]